LPTAHDRLLAQDAEWWAQRADDCRTTLMLGGRGEASPARYAAQWL